MTVTARQHIATVMQVAARPDTYRELTAPHEDIIRASWLRCVHEHRLDPTRMQQAVILPQARLREHKEQMESLLNIARHGLESLYSKVSGLGYVVLLTDGDFNVGVSDPSRLKDFVADKRKTGVYLSVYGFGRGNYNDELMQALAQNGNGTAAYVDTYEEARKLFRDDFSG